MKPAPKAVEQILEALATCRTVCVVGHIRPDGDCIGSQVGLGLALEGAGKSVTIWNDDGCPEKLRILDPGRRVTAPVPGRKFDAVIATDCASFERLGRCGEHVGDRRVFLNIDHHGSNTRYADINWISPREPSTGELIYDLCRWAGWKITRPIADCLFAAVSTDTGSFQYATTTPDTLRTAAELVEAGADLGRICEEVYQSYPLTRVRLLRQVYNKFRLTHNNQVGYFWLKQSDYSRAGAAPEESEGLIDHIRAIEGVVVAVMLEEMEPDLTRLSLRSKSDRVDVSAIAALFGGGGHKAAAGARYQGSPLGLQRRLLSAIRLALNGKPLPARK
ncbi:MAG: bifunctional oligoribonuclease/PAP phosphatase NrnA [Verrucomicrobiae bacterium]|nr:bifunctional oligoribonuclease/PAP phosphatase NrnA [Verrucomicrobiae bacterium]